MPTLGVGRGTESEGRAGTRTRLGVGQHLVHLVLSTQQTRSTRRHTGKSGLDLFLYPFLQQLVKMYAMLNRTPSANQSSGLNNHATTVKLPIIYFLLTVQTDQSVIEAIPVLKGNQVLTDRSFKNGDNRTGCVF